jgi:hypothetical protein
MNLNLPPRQRLLVIVIASLIGLYALDSWVFEPLLGVWQAHTAEIVQLRKSVANGRSLMARASQLDRVWSQMQANALPKEQGQAEHDVISAIDGWGRANYVELPSIRPQWKRGATDRSSLLECRVDATGTMAALSHFMYELERSPLALHVDSIEVTARDDGGQKLTLGLVVSGLRLSPLERKS